MPGDYTPHDIIVRVIECHKIGLKTSEIVSQTGVKRRTVQNLVRKFKEGGSVEVPVHVHAGGGALKVSPRSLKVLKQDIESNPTLTARQLKVSNAGIVGEASVRTIQRRLHDDLGYRKVAARKKPLITEKQKENRISFAKKYSDWDKAKWRRVLWSDEATFQMSDSAGKRVWVGPNSDPPSAKRMARSVKFPQYLMVWACFGYGGVGDFVVLPGNQTVNQVSYYTILNDYLETSFEKSKTDIFQQDGTPCHIAKSVKNWFSDCGIEYIEDWPGNSPDISPIENLWAIIKRKLREVDTTTITKLELELHRAWESIPLQTLQNLADSVPRRLQEVIRVSLLNTRGVDGNTSCSLERALGNSSPVQGMHDSQAVLYHHDKAIVTGEKEHIFLTNDETSISENNFELLNNLWQEKITSEGLNKTDVIEAVKAYAANHPEITIKSSASGGKFSIALVTDFMKKCHYAFEEVQELCYIDTALHSKAKSTAVTVFMAASPAGAVPLGVIFCSSQDVGVFLKGFDLLKEAMGPTAFYGKQHPEAFMIKDSGAIKEALEAVWPNSNVLLRSSDLLHNIRRKLFDPKYPNVTDNDRRQVISIMKQLIHSNSDKELERFTNKFTNFMKGEMSKIKEIQSFFEKYIRRKSEWSHASQVEHIKESLRFSNSICDPAIYMFKHIITDRCKIYNLASLVMYTSEIFSGYLQQRLLDRGVGEKEKLLSQQTIDKYNITDHGNEAFTIISKMEENTYEIDLQLGICSCQSKYPITPCEHQFVCAEVATIGLPASVMGFDELRKKLILVGLKEQGNKSEVPSTLTAQVQEHAEDSTENAVKFEPYEEVTIKYEDYDFEDYIYQTDLPSTSSLESEELLTTTTKGNPLESQMDPLSLNQGIKESTKRPYEEMYTKEEKHVGGHISKEKDIHESELLALDLNHEGLPPKRSRLEPFEGSEILEVNVLPQLPTSQDLYSNGPSQKANYSNPTLQSLKEECLNPFELFGVHVAKELSTVLDQHSFNQAKLKIDEIISKAKSGHFKLE